MNIEKLHENIKAMDKGNRSSIPVAFRLTVDDYVEVQHYKELFGFRTTSAFLTALIKNFIIEQKEWEQKSQKGEK